MKTKEQLLQEQIDNNSVKEPKVETPENKEEFVTRKSYDEVSQDMHKNKQRVKELEDEKRALLAEKDAKAKEDLEEAGQWQTLYQQNAEKVKELEAARTNDRKAFMNEQKKNKVIALIGGFKKPEYDFVVNVANIVDSEGQINMDTVQAEADRIKQNHSELLKSSKGPRLPNDAPSSEGFDQELSLETITPSQRDAFIQAELRKRSK